MSFERVWSGSPWEGKVGYCRAVKAGPHVHVSGTTPMADGQVVAPGDAYAQTRRCLEIALGALAELGGSAAHVVRVRMFVTDISRWQEYGRAHGEVFAAHPPTNTMVEVKALIDPAILVEVELEAYLG
ncbi:MAG TPA: RidA family protein [Thermoanaerobaculia bacterium]|nr:RidA family protein [Thermoanaerobaculia bacterium]